MRAKYPLLVMFLITVFVYGVSHTYGDFKVEVGYINGILTASGILFGMWAILIGRKPTEPTKRFFYETIIRESFILSFGLLTISVLFVFLTAVNVMSSVATLMIFAFSFSMNAIGITFTLFYYKFKEKEHEEFVRNLRIRCSNCGHRNSVSVNKVLIEQPSPEPQVKVMIPMYEPLETSKCVKCGKILAEPKELIRITKKQ